MAIKKKPYELSVWDEKLVAEGQKEETKRVIIGSHNMDYLGRATAIKLQCKLNGTHTLTFQMPSKFFDSEKGSYVRNEFCDYIFNERKIKLKYKPDWNKKDEWLEFYVKNISESKQYKSIMYTYTCQDAFIDELARNGYGITFDTELYNNVEEIGTFTEIILEDSIWSYDASLNIGDFTQYSEEKLFKIPVSQFTKINGYKLKYEISEETITNVFTGEERPMEMGDDLAREKSYFWDNGSFDNGFELVGQNKITDIENDGYIYVPYNQLDFCYVSDPAGGFFATEVAQIGEIAGIKSYLLSPSKIDPTKLIQFIAIPKGADITIDESGLLVNKDYTYVMTVEDWNKTVNTGYYYAFEDCDKKIETNAVFDGVRQIHGNMAVTYDGYLETMGDVEINFGKAVSVADRTECNISKEIDQFVTVYQNKQSEFSSMFTNPDWVVGHNEDDYRICSKIATRQIIPQLARNLLQNGVEITKVDGWELMKSDIEVESNDDLIASAAQLAIYHPETDSEDAIPLEDYHLEFTPSTKQNASIEDNTFINFGIVGQEKTIDVDKIYYLRIDKPTGEIEGKNYGDTITIVIGEGSVDASGDYSISGNNIVIIENYELGQEYLIKFQKQILNPYFAIQSTNQIGISKAYFFEAYTKGIDFFEEGYFKYSGRDLCYSPENVSGPIAWQQVTGNYCLGTFLAEYSGSKCVLFENDIMEGATYEYRQYFKQQLVVDDKQFDTFMAKKFLSDEGDLNSLPLSSSDYTEDDYKINTNFLDMTKCPYYGGLSAANECDCNYNDESHICMYQKYGYCPYLFKTQKHCRKINTLNGEKSNRFNLTQEIGKIFEVYPVYYIEHEENGTIKKDSNGRMIKRVFYMTEKGKENKLGFRYEKNLSNISRTFDSNQIVTKLYVEDVDSDLSKTGLCSIKTAEDNPSKDSFIIDFSYYTLKGLLDKKEADMDLYGNGTDDMGYLKQLGYLNTKYDELSNKIINLQDQSYTELEANIQVNLTGIETIMQEINKTKKKIARYKNHAAENNTSVEKLEESDTYKSYLNTLQEQQSILNGLIINTFFKDNVCIYKTTLNTWESRTLKLDQFSAFNYFDNITIKEMIKLVNEEKSSIYNSNSSISNLLTCGMLGQYLTEYKQIQDWKKEREKYLKDINKLSLHFYQKYEPFLKEGTWSDSNYLSDNSYYFGAKEVAKEGAIPKITYSISVVDLDVLDESGDFCFEIADTSYIEDIETFGINQKTGLPNRLKVIISGITYNLDIPSQNSIQIQNYTTQFEDLFQQISASVQSLSFNENIYKRSSNFTSTQNVEKDSLQGALDENDLTLIETQEKNIALDQTGQSGSDINNHNNKYKLNGQGLFFSNNGGQSWNVGVGPGGINADYIKVGTLDAGRIRIVDNGYLYFLWDKNGITAYREPQSVDNINFTDFSRFNKFGLSLVEKGKIRLRAGYEFSGDTQTDEAGNFITEQHIAENANIGFYLYNSNGQPIFKTEPVTQLTSEDAAIETARISLSGEIFVTDDRLKNESSGEYLDTYYKIKCNNGYQIENRMVSIYEEENWPIQLVQLLDGQITDSIAYDPPRDENGDSIYYLKTIMSLYKEHNKIKYEEQNVDTVYTENGVYVNTLKERIYYVNVLYQYLDQNHELIREEEKEKDYYFTVLGDENLFNEHKTLNIHATKNINVALSQYQGIKELWSANTNIPDVKVTYYPAYENGYHTKITEQNFSVLQDGLIRYWESYEVTEDSKDIIKDGNITDSIALFINNKISVQKAPPEEEDETVSKRIFSCISDSKNSDEEPQKQNIFTIVKKGDLYIGGEVTGPKSSNLSQIPLSEIPDEIGIKNPQIWMTTDGELRMDFDKFKTIDGKQSLVDFVAGMVADAKLIRHKHNLSSIKFDKNDGKLYYITIVAKEGFNPLNDLTQHWQQWYATSAQNLQRKLLYLNLNPDSWLNKTEEEIFNYIGDSNDEREILKEKCQLVYIPINNIEYNISGETDYAGQGAYGGGAFSGYFLPDPIDQ